MQRSRPAQQSSYSGVAVARRTRTPPASGGSGASSSWRATARAASTKRAEPRRSVAQRWRPAHGGFAHAEMLAVQTHGASAGVGSPQ